MHSRGRRSVLAPCWGLGMIPVREGIEAVAAGPCGTRPWGWAVVAELGARQVDLPGRLARRIAAKRHGQRGGAGRGHGALGALGLGNGLTHGPATIARLGRA